MARLFSEHSAVSERPKERRVDMTSADYAVMEAALDVEYTGNPGTLFLASLLLLTFSEAIFRPHTP